MKYELKQEDYPEKGVRLKAYFNELKFDDSLRNKIKTAVTNLENIDSTVLNFSEQTIAEVDWENEVEKLFSSFRASEKFTIVPSWEQYTKEDDSEMCIELDQVWHLELEIIQQQACV